MLNIGKVMYKHDETICGHIHKGHITGHFIFPSEGEGKMIHDVPHLRKIGVKAILLSFPFLSLGREVLLIFRLVSAIREH